MIILDTNVLSESLRDLPSPTVINWLDRHSPTELFTTAITEAEILYGVALLPDGRRKTLLHQGAQRLFLKLLRDRVLPFDSKAAHAYSQIASMRRALGRPMPQLDAQIGAIALANAAAIATRNTADFEGCGIELVNPWRE